MDVSGVLLTVAGRDNLLTVAAGDNLLSAAEGEEEGGFHAPGLGLFQWEPLFSVGGFDFTKPMLLALVAAGLVLAFFAAAFAQPKVVPSRIQNLGEIGYLFVRDQIARQVIGKHADRYVPFLVALFFFVWMMNLMAVIPVAQFPVPSRIAFPAALAVIVWITFLALGIKNQGLVGYFKNIMFPPGVPKPIYVLLTPIEFISTILVRPFSLAVRLFANLLAGHLILVSFAVLTHALWDSTKVGFVLPFALLVALTAFEVLVALLQAYIFTILTAVFIGGAMHPEH